MKNLKRSDDGPKDLPFAREATECNQDGRTLTSYLEKMRKNDGDDDDDDDHDDDDGGMSMTSGSRSNAGGEMRRSTLNWFRSFLPFYYRFN